MNIGALAGRAAELVRESARWRLVSLLLERPRAGWHAELGALARELGDEDLAEAVRAAEQASEGRYLAIFGPGGSVSPREAGHRKVADPGRLLAELAAFYRSFAYSPAREEPLDHAAVEAGFVAYLALKEAYALARDDGAAARACAAARSDFMRLHLATFAEPMAEAIEHEESHLALAARALARLAGPCPREAQGAWSPHGLDGPGCGFSCAGESEVPEVFQDLPL